MKATDFNLSTDLILNSETGIALFRDSRLVILDAGALGLLRQNLVKDIGAERARAFFLRFGYGAGYSDFQQMKTKYSFDSEMELLASGPVIHTWEGIVKATPTEIRFNRSEGSFYFTGRWTNSYEAEQYLSFNDPSDEGVCWSLAGYASGWCSAFFGAPLIAMEPHCVGRGDPECGWLIKPVKDWGPEAKPYIDALSSLLGDF